jgi:gliding motility-associated-like protein
VERGDQFAWYLNDEPMESETDSTLSIIELIDQIEYNQEYKYSLTLKNSCGIYTSDNSLDIIFNECNCALEMPNVFTPNNDSKNNVFKPLNNHEDETDAERICESTNYSMNIYNQWGKHMASVESGNELPSWNGKNKKGNEVAEGIYFYNIVYQVNVYTAPKQMEYTGSFHLYR